MVENAAQRLELCSPENVLALCFCAPKPPQALAGWSVLHYKYDLFTMHHSVTPPIYPASWDCMHFKWDNTFILLAFSLHLKWACASVQLCGSGSVWSWVFPVPGVTDELVQSSGPGDQVVPSEMESLWCCLDTDNTVRSERQWMRQSHFTCRNCTLPSLRLPLELCRHPRHPFGGKPSFGGSLLLHKSHTAASLSPGFGGWQCSVSRSLSQAGAGGAAVEFCASYRAESSLEVKIATLVSIW